MPAFLAGQPPSGGCVLKHFDSFRVGVLLRPAAFGRLCVETAAYLPNTSAKKTSRLRAAVC